ncbi:hypothetical protein [Bradyrhizobium sp. UNPA324]|uniref:hypothetical protein n=1 Tax=Bradyrhizobium sp. UNPA324 TaxID=1141174 RepID=UPI0011505003|nr:hypothetical protein [Bradyrhizobium sp. UNPA324]TQF29160.1 hypothetical protein UNPA324_05530 [Bradyrhizobium sp. UNPA324]
MADKLEYEQVECWLQVRRAEIMREWGNAVCDVIGDAPWSIETIVRLDDAANKQARAERLAYMYGEPLPNSDAALAELIDRVRSGKSDNRKPRSLPPCGRSLFGSDISFSNPEAIE